MTRVAQKVPAFRFLQADRTADSVYPSAQVVRSTPMHQHTLYLLLMLAELRCLRPPTTRKAPRKRRKK
jgi:hypothetical protein